MTDDGGPRTGAGADDPGPGDPSPSAARPSGSRPSDNRPSVTRPSDDRPSVTRPDDTTAPRGPARDPLPADATGSGARVLPDRGAGDAEIAWGDPLPDAQDDERLLRERPPHWA